MSAAEGSGCDPGQQHARPGDSANTVNDRLTSKRARPVVGNDEYAAFARRIRRAYAWRIADGDIESLS
jgi:hypothetical protein